MRRRILLTALWLLSDAAIFVAAYVLAYFIKVGWIFSTDFLFERYIAIVVLITPAWLFAMVTMRNFSLTRSQGSPRNAAYIIYACIIGMAMFALAYYFLEQTLFSRSLLLMAGVYSAAGIIAWHVLFDRIQRIALRANAPVYPLLVVGVNREAEHIITHLQRRHSPFMPVAVIDPRGTGRKHVGGVPVVGKLHVIEEVIRTKKITHLLQCDCLEQSMNLSGICRQNGITYLLLPYTLGVINQWVPAESLEGNSVIAVHPHNAWWEWFFR